ncbi:MAG: ABC transporter substrate-binding protein, partial [Pseudomonadota bacterium]
MRKILVPLLLLTAVACGGEDTTTTPAQAPAISAPEGATSVPMAYTETFQVFERDGYRIVDLKAPVVSWGGEAQGADQTARIVLVPKEIEPPALTGDLKDAVIVRTPVERIAVNYGFLEAIVTALGVNDRLVAVGGVKNYNDDIRARAKSGELAQVGYGWHMPPMIDPLLNSEPDVFLMVLGDLGHAEHYERIKDLGVPAVPVFFEAEMTYMGPVDYVHLIGMMTGREEAAEDFVSMVAGNVNELKALVADAPKKKVLGSWYSGNGRWMVTVRNADNSLLEDAGGINPLAQPDDIRQDDFVRLGTEVLLEEARDIDCWVIRDTHSMPFDDVSILQNFKAWREGCLFAGDGMAKPDADAFDIYETG